MAIARAIAAFRAEVIFIAPYARFFFFAPPLRWR